MYYNHKDGVLLRKTGKRDLFDLLNLKKEWWGTHNTLITSIEDQERWFNNLSCNELIMTAMVVDEIEKPCGVSIYTDIDWLGRTLNISGSIFAGFRKSEISKPAFSCGLDFAFEILNMQRVGAEVLESNWAARTIEIDHLGFTVEGVRRKAIYKSGRYYNSLVLGILREEWECQDRVKSYGGSCNKDFDHDQAEKFIERLNRDNHAVSRN